MLSRFLTRNEQFVFVALAGAICVGAGVLFIRPPEKPVSEKTVLRTSHVASAVVPSADVVFERKDKSDSFVRAVVDSMDDDVETGNRDKIRVAVMGWVRYPGAYDFTIGDRVEDALTRAGGVAEGADISNINLAAPLIDGTTLTIPRGRVATIQDKKLVVKGGDYVRAINPIEYTLSGMGATTRSTTKESRNPFNIPNMPLDLNSASQKELESLPGIGPVLARRIMDARPYEEVDDLLRVEGIGAKRLEQLKPHVTVR